MQVQLENLTFGYTDPLFADLSLTIAAQDRLAIVGNNGGGKSTLLRCIAGEIDPNQGRVITPKNCRFGFMPQDLPDALRPMTLEAAVIDAIPEIDRAANLWKAEIALDSLEAPQEFRQKPLQELSGGWQRLALIMRAWMMEPDVLLLDEPTNHLDVAKIILLERWLNNQVYNTPIIMISHDRRFLNACTNRTGFLRNSKLTVYDAPYDRARAMLAEDDEAAAKKRATELKELGRLEASAQTLKQIGKNNFSDEALRKAKQIQARAEKLRESLTNTHRETRRDIKLTNRGTHAKVLLHVQNYDVKAPNGDMLFHVEDLKICQGDRVVILGKNGSGKSVFLGHLHDAFRKKDRGRDAAIKITPTALLAFLDQHLSFVPDDQKLYDYFRHEFALLDQRVISLLTEIGFAYDDQQMKIGRLSQGQKARVALLALRLMEPNFYIMDEPTNHLDIMGQEQLESEIIFHEASSVFISHDRAFVQNLGTRFLEIKAPTRRDRPWGLVEIDDPEPFYETLLGDE